MSYKELTPNIKKFYDLIYRDKSKEFINLLTNNQIIGWPYSNGIDTFYYDPRLIGRTNLTLGMCAGNSEHEALVQGISELMEIYCIINFYTKKEDKYYTFTKQNIINNKLKNIVEKIEENNNSLYFLDCSHQYSLPVIGVILVNKTDNNIIVNFGASPIFDIALERCLTEIY